MTAKQTEAPTRRTRRTRRRPKRVMPKKRPRADSPEHVKAMWWRIYVLKVTREKLAELVGYSADAIKAYERGTNAEGEAIGEGAWRRYRNACAAVAVGVKFDWLNATVTIAPQYRD